MAVCPSLRYALVRLTGCPCGTADPLLPVFGGRSVIEILALLAEAVILLVLSFSLPSHSVGSLADKLGGLLLLYSLRNANLATALLGISFERMLLLHKTGGALVAMVAFVHGCREWTTNTTGFAAALTLVLLCASYLLKYADFNYFYFTHMTLCLCLIPLLFAHGAVFFALCCVLWVFDVFSRYLLHSHTVTAKIRLLTNELVRVEFPMLFQDTHPGQYCFLMVKDISAKEFHPFSMASANHHSNNVFYVKTGGDWTNSLKRLCMTSDKGNKGDGEGIVEMVVEGPYGSLSLDLYNEDKYPVLVFIAGGSGITPFLGMLGHLLYQYQKGCLQRLEKVIMVWTVRDSSFGDAIYRDSLMPIVQDSAEIHHSTVVSTMSTQSPLHEITKGNELIINIPKRGVFEFHFHLTQRGKKGAGDDDDRKRNMTHPHMWTVGRPNLSTVLEDARKALKTSHSKPSLALPSGGKEYTVVNPSESSVSSDGPCRVGVMACGSQALIEDVQMRIIAENNKKDVQFDLHVERFEF